MVQERKTCKSTRTDHFLHLRTTSVITKSGYLCVDHHRAPRIAQHAHPGGRVEQEFFGDDRHGGRVHLARKERAEHKAQGRASSNNGDERVKYHVLIVRSILAPNSNVNVN